jgi:hypothetical protein
MDRVRRVLFLPSASSENIQMCPPLSLNSPPPPSLTLGEDKTVRVFAGTIADFVPINGVPVGDAMANDFASGGGGAVLLTAQLRRGRRRRLLRQQRARNHLLRHIRQAISPFKEVRRARGCPPPPS